MTISNTTVKQRYTGNGATTTFAIPAQLQDNDQLEVILRDENVDPPTETTQVETTDFTITGGDPGTNVVMGTAPAVGEILLVRRKTPKTQLTDYDNNTAFPAESHERALDKIVQQIQELQEELSRAVKFAASSEFADAEMPDLLPGKVVTVNSAGDGFELEDPDSFGGSGGGGISLSVFGSRATPRSIVNADGVNATDGHMSLTALEQVIFVEGSIAGENDVSADPQVEAHTEVGAKIRFIGRNDANPVKFENGTGLALNGECVLTANKILDLVWDGTEYVEASRSN